MQTTPITTPLRFSAMWNGLCGSTFVTSPMLTSDGAIAQAERLLNNFNLPMPIDERVRIVLVNTNADVIAPVETLPLSLVIDGPAPQPNTL